MSIRVIQTDAAPAAIGSYSQAIQANGFLFVSGQVGLNLETGHLYSSFTDQAHAAFHHIQSIIEASGGHLSRVVKLNIALADMTYFSDLNNVMTAHFEQPYPARAVIAVSELPKQALIEIEAVVALDD